MAFRVLIIGGTGQVGAAVVRALMAESSCAEAVMVNRKALSLTPDPRLRQVILDTAAAQFPAEVTKLAQELVAHGDPVCGASCVGVGKGSATWSEQDLIALEIGVVGGFARACHAGGIRRFAMLSAAGSTSNSKIRYVRIMGLKEETVEAVGFERLTILRPGIIGGNVHTPRYVEWLGRLIPGKFGTIDQDDVGRAVVAEFTGSSLAKGVVYLENGEMRQLSRLRALAVAAVLSAATLGTFTLATAPVAARAAEVTVLSAIGMRQVMLDLGPAFERATGHTLAITFDSTGLVAKRIASGETVDVVMINRSALELLEKDGKVIASSIAHIARSVAAVAVRKGAAKPDISSPEAFKRLLLAATSVARPPPAVGGSSGDHIVEVLERLGIAAEVNAKSVLVMTGNTGDLAESPGDAVAKGKAEIALHQLQELIAVPGIEIVGPFPGGLQGSFAFSAAIGTTARETDAGKALIEFLRTPQARDVMRAKGMEPSAPD